MALVRIILINVLSEYGKLEGEVVGVSGKFVKLQREIYLSNSEFLQRSAEQNIM